LKIQEHLGKLSWSFADKSLYLMWAFVVLFQMRAMEPDEYGIFTLLISIYSWIFSVAESISVQMIIQFGTFPEDRPKVNFMTLIMFILMIIGITAIFYLFQGVIVTLFHEQRFYKIALILPFLSIVTIPRFFSLKMIYRDRLFNKLFFVDLAYFGTMSIMTVVKLFNSKKIYFNDMVWVYVIGAIISSAFGLIIVRKELIFSMKGKVRLKEILKISIPLTLYNSLNNMPKYLDTIIIQYFFSASAVGIYQSAKNLFRFFDDACNTAGSIIYPSAIRLINFKNFKGLNDLITKAVSFVLSGFIVIIIIFESGLSKFIINTLLVRYLPSISQFNLLALAALTLPFIILSGIITASGKPQVVLKYVFASIIIWFGTMFAVGLSKNTALIPLAQIIYTTIFGILCYFYAKRHFDFKPAQIFRSFGDTYNFFVKK
jgi:O-antigen/teichoic acid export membrane protein